MKKLHQMKLMNHPFEQIRQGKKVIEVRLNDPKRRRVHVGDQIIFNKLPDEEQSLTAKVTELLRFDTFHQLFSQIPPNETGCQSNSIAERVNIMYKIYDQEDEQKWGVIGIRLEVKE